MSVAAAEQAALEYVKQHVPKPATAPLCGNSIGTDRGFLARYMTEFDDYLALPEHRRFVVQGALPALEPGALPQAPG